MNIFEFYIEELINESTAEDRFLIKKQTESKILEKYFNDNDFVFSKLEKKDLINNINKKRFSEKEINEKEKKELILKIDKDNPFTEKEKLFLIGNFLRKKIDSEIIDQYLKINNKQYNQILDAEKEKYLLEFDKLNPYDELEKYSDSSNFFISFRDMNKIGLNPQSYYDFSPNGIYTYPLQLIWKKFDHQKRKIVVPYLGHLPYIYLIKKENNIKGIDLKNYSENSFKADLEKLKQNFEPEKVLKKYEPIKNKQPGEKIWTLTRKLATKNKEVKINSWNLILSKILGYSYVIDPGLGIIDGGEPTQAVFLNTKTFKVIKIIENKRHIKRKDFKNGKKGIWKDPVWIDGVWLDGTWQGRTWKDGFWIKGTWKGITWEEGVWKNGTWESGTWEGGFWENGIWKGGDWEGGVWENGVWEKGTWHDGTWLSGTWLGGTWLGGTWKEGLDKNGNIKYDPPDMW